MKPATSYTGDEMLRLLSTRVLSDGIIEINGYCYKWDKVSHAFLLQEPEPVMFVSKDDVAGIEEKIKQEDEKNLTTGRNQASIDRLNILRSHTLVASQNIEYFKNGFK